jgi:hypothetical protein
MIYKELNKLQQHRRDIMSLIDAAYRSSADPEIVMFTVNDLQWDLDIVEKAIEEERMMIPFKWGLAAFIVCSMGLIIYGLILS